MLQGQQQEVEELNALIAPYKNDAAELARKVAPNKK